MTILRPVPHDSPGDMTPLRKRKPLPDMPLECPNCLSPDVDEQARECRSCKIGIPLGASMHKRRQYVTTRNQRIDGALQNQANQQGINESGWRR